MMTSVVVLTGIASAEEAAGDTRVEPLARVGVYQDSDHTTILTATSAVNGTVSDRVQVGAHYLVDAVSSASVDVVTQATGRFRDTRHDVAGNVGYKDERRAIAAVYSYSTENDWKSHNAALAASQDLAQHNVTLGLSLGIQQNAITRSHSIGFSEHLRAYLGNAFVGLTLTPRDLLQLSIAVSYYDGFQSSPYRYVIVAGQAYLESYPEQRWREAVVLRHHHYFIGRRWALRSHLRAYSDSYGVRALTAGTEGVIDREPFDIAFAVRGYGQNKASFYREEYPAVQPYMAIDKELSTFVDVFAGPTIGYSRRAAGPFELLRADLRASAFYFHYFDFARLDRRYGIVADVGFSATF